MRAILIGLVLLIPTAALAQHGHSSKEQATALTAGLGQVNHPVTTRNLEAQKFFNQGLACIYGFNHEEAVRSFKRAAELDPSMAMAYWGIALSLGSNYNLQADAPQLKEAFGNLQRALTLAPNSSESDRAYVEALARRYSADTTADRQKLASDYRNAMGNLMKRFPDDMDAATLYAESIMNLRPWKLWSLDGKPAEDTLEIVSVLENVLKRDPNHLGANHYYIHAVEASQSPERAVSSAERLGKLAPNSGHLVHMPSHIYIRTGDYHSAAIANQDAIRADRRYITEKGVDGVYTMVYYNHNIHFLAAANAMKGRYRDAIKSAQELKLSVEPHLKVMPMLEMFSVYPTVTRVRFHRWNEIFKLAEPSPELKVSRAFWHFARGMAYAATRQTTSAELALNDFRSVVKEIPPDTPFGNNTSLNVLRVAENMLAAKIAFVEGDRDAAFKLFRVAVDAEDAVAYNEPPDWDLPVRELYGAALLVAGNYVDAENVFRAELNKHKRNGRALFGLAQSLKGQKRFAEARTADRAFLRAWSTADTKLSLAELSGISR